MRELVVRALIHRAALGDGESPDVAASVAEGTDNLVLPGMIVANSSLRLLVEVEGGEDPASPVASASRTRPKPSPLGPPCESGRTS
jgi:hypothetical protein